MKYDNTVIKVKTIKHGAEVIKWWKNQGVDTGIMEGTINEQAGHSCIYYGLIRGKFENYPYSMIEGIDIIELPKELPNRGDKIMVTDGSTSWCERIYIGNLEGTKFPVVVVVPSDEQRFLEGKEFSVSLWKYWKPIEENVVELTMEDISKGKGVGVKPELIRIKK